MAIQIRLFGANTTDIFCYISDEFNFGRLLKILYIEQAYNC